MSQRQAAAGTERGGEATLLLWDRRFWPLFWAQALGAFNDNLLKGAVVLIAVYQAPAGSGAAVAMVAGALLVLPFLLFSALAGQLADRLPKPRLVRRLKAVELAVAILGAGALLAGDLAWLLLVVFLMGTQSAFFGPLKYGLLPEYFRERELLSANAYVEASTFLVILLGTIGGSLLVSFAGGRALVAAAVVLVALAGYLASRFLPPRPAQAPGLALRFNPLSACAEVLSYVVARRELRRTVLGISWFWAIGGIYLTQVPAYARDVLGAEERTATLLLALFVIGIAAGAGGVRLALRGRVRLWPVPWAMLLVALWGLDFALLAGSIVPAQAPLDLARLWQLDWAPRLMADLFLLAFFGGAFAVPLYAHLQLHSAPTHVARSIAANNILNALFLVGSAILTAALLYAGMAVPDLLAGLALANLAAAALGFLWFRKRPV